MELTGSQIIDAPREKVWAGLMDIELLREAIPGCESILDEGDGTYSAVVLASIGPVRARFRGRMQQQNMRPAEQYGLRFEGEGGIAGFAKGTALVTLENAGEKSEKTHLSYRADTTIGGRLAQIGSRLIDAAAERMARQFFTRFEQLLSAPESDVQETVLTNAALSTPSDVQLVGAAAHRANPPGAVPMSGQFTLQMPAWAWALTVIVLAGSAVWLGTH